MDPYQYPNILGVAQCSAPEIPTFSEAFFDLFESKVTAAIGITAFVDSSFAALIDPNWPEYEIAPILAWHQACFQVANSYLDQSEAPKIVFRQPAVGAERWVISGRSDELYFTGAVIIELLQEWTILSLEDPFFDDFGPWLSEAHRIRCSECGDAKLDRTDPNLTICDACGWEDTVSLLESTDTHTKPSNPFQQHTLMSLVKDMPPPLVFDLTDIPLIDSLGDVFLDTCLELGLVNWKQSEVLINRRHLHRHY